MCHPPEYAFRGGIYYTILIILTTPLETVTRPLPAVVV
jgi:hypothetical protein